MAKVIDRKEVSRALAKALAFAECGKSAAAADWAAELVRLLDCADILRSTMTVAEARTAGQVAFRRSQVGGFTERLETVKGRQPAFLARQLTPMGRI